MAEILIVARTGPATSDAPLLLARAFRALGWDAGVFAMDEDLPSRERVLGALGVPQDHRVWLRLFNGRLRRELAATRPAALVLFGSNWNVLPETLLHARRLGTMSALWECNHWFHAAFQRDALTLYDCYFDLDSHFVAEARAAGVARAEHLPGCADLDEHAPQDLGAEDVARYGAQVSFVGSPYPERLPYLEAVSDLGLRLWGFGWDRVPSPALRSAVRPEPVYGLKKTRIYCASIVNLNVQGKRMVHGENFRLFEVAACGAFCLTTPKPDLERWFRRGEDLETFTDVDELRRQVQRFVADPAARRARATAARATVARGHTYGHRAQAIVDALGLGGRRAEVG